MDTIYILVALFCCRPALAIPIPDPLVSVEAGPPPVALVLGLSIPFVVLAAAKYAYMKYRRADSIHSEAAQAEVEAEVKTSPALIGLGLDAAVLRGDSRKFKLKILSGYFVGMLGSPEWETRVKVRMDKAIRKLRSQSLDVELSSRAVSFSTASRSRFNSSHRSHDTSTGFRSSRHVSSTASSKSRTMSLSFLDMYSPDSNVMTTGGNQSSSSPCIDGTPRLPTFSDSGRSLSSSSRRSHKQSSMASLSPSVTQMQDLFVSAWQELEDVYKRHVPQDTDSNGRSRSHSPTPPFQTPLTTPAKSLNSSQGSGSSGKNSNKSMSTISRDVPQSSPSQHLQFPSSVSKESPVDKARRASPKLNNAPLFSTTRPLNVDNSRLPSVKPDSECLPVNPAKYLVERSIAPRSKSQNRKSSSPSIGPSPLRNPVTSSSSSSLSKANLIPPSKSSDSRPSPATFAPDAPSWELDDLMKNGQLDIDAVTEALGLGFSLSDNSTSPSRSQSPTHTFNLSESLFRKPGGPLCSIPEETDADDSVVDENVRPLSSLIERWGWIHQKFSVETAGEVRESVSSSILEVDLSLLGIDVSAISGIGTPIGLSGSGNSFRDTTYTIEALEPDEDSSGWLEDSNTSNEGVGLAC